VTVAGLAPGVAPAPITGRLVNHGVGTTHITAVDVEIAFIAPMPNSSAGACGANDYKLIAPRMPVGRNLGPGGSTGFAGASIGFDNKKTNQDACKGAAIHLLYTANASCTLVPHHHPETPSASQARPGSPVTARTRRIVPFEWTISPVRSTGGSITSPNPGRSLAPLVSADAW